MLAEVPSPSSSGGCLQIRTLSSVVSLGTEKMLIDFGKAGWVAKAKQQPDKVKQVLAKVRTDGLAATYKAVQAKLDVAIPLGYANCGFVLDAPPHSGFATGDLVVSNGHHAEVVSVPVNLCAKVPEGVEMEAAAFTVIGAIALQGVRLIQPSVGETIVVTGLGLIGQLAVQILRASGCRVIGIDVDAWKCQLAQNAGAETVNLSAGEDPVAVAEKLTLGHGVDGVLVTASTRSNEPMHQAATMCRKRGRIVLVGVTGLELMRSDFYEKELSFQVSCSYGPGRYEPNYESKGMDYPIGFVRWTEQRNFQAFLNLLAEGKVNVGPLISHRIEFDHALEGYEKLNGGQAMGIVLDYASGRKALEERRAGEKSLGTLASHIALKSSPAAGSTTPVIGLIGAGSFTTQVLLPALKETGPRLKTIVSSKGVSGTHAGQKFGFECSATEARQVLEDPEIDTVFVTTRHNSHAGFVLKALEAGKHVFVEKPLCVTLDECENIQRLFADDALTLPQLMVGFNRRFSPHMQWMSEQLRSVSSVPKSLVITVNAGAIPPDHWVHDPAEGGGRITGEACHFIDLARFLVGHPIVKSSASFQGEVTEGRGDDATLQLRFEDGSIASIHYLACGNKAFPKERVEVFAGGKVIACDNFRLTRGWGVKGKCKTWKQDKGHRHCVKAFLQAVREGKPAPIPPGELLEVSEHAIRLSEPD